MICDHCQTRWTLNEYTHQALCPKCGQPSTPENLAEGLWAVKTLCGEGFMSDGNKLISVFADFAPLLKKERNLLKQFVDAGGHHKLYAVKDASADKQENACKTVIRDLSENWGMAESFAIEVCRAYFAAFDVQLPLTTSRKTPPPKPPVQDPPKKKDPPSTRPKNDPPPKKDPPKTAEGPVMPKAIKVRKVWEIIIALWMLASSVAVFCLTNPLIGIVAFAAYFGIFMAFRALFLRKNYQDLINAGFSAEQIDQILSKQDSNLKGRVS